MSLTPMEPPRWPADWEVPRGEYAQGFSRRTGYGLVIPVINEGARFMDQLRGMHAAGIMNLTDVIIADGGSTDGTTDHDALATLGVRALIVKRDSGRLSAQLRMGYAYAMQEGYEGVLTIDGNGKDSVESVADFVAALDQGYDYVQASRFIAGGRAENTPPVRLLAIRLVHAPLISLAARHWFTDTTQGYRAYSRRYLLDPRVRPFRRIFDSYELLAYLSARCTRIGLRATEIPTTRAYPAKGPVPTKISHVRGNATLIRILLQTLRGAYNPPATPRS
ncbi:glycosyltransferase family 2 protein [Nitratidesulfovibrio oxamicus]|uniref:glycosyltransferase family 2 protein n=1 Tax=Nitratidesulfovibrio oxamicus TaxID=32016 RepID=UPI0018C536E8|nr:glycosyltransferase family 2 protein [Nitratidesulfovibrio oxamicus]